MSTTTAIRAEYLDRFKDHLDHWNAEIDKYEAQGEELRGDARQRYDDQLANFRQQLNSMKDRWDELNGAGQDKYDELAGEIDHLRKAFIQSFNYFKTQV